MKDRDAVMALFDHSAETYDEWCSTPLGSFVDELENEIMKEVAQPKKNEKALDLGCGTGIYSLWLSEQDVIVTGIDISSEMLKKAKSKAEDKNQNIEFIKGDIHSLPFPDQTFDLILSNIVLEFVDSPEKVISEGLRVLKQGGRLVIGIIGRHSEWAKLYEKRGKDKKESVFFNAHFFDVQEVNNLSPIKPADVHFGLYFTPREFVNKEQVRILEKERSKQQKEENAGFVVCKWIKKNI